MTLRRAVAAALCLWIFAQAGSGASPPVTVVAVLGSELAPYQEALSAFQETLGRPVPVFRLREGDPRWPEGLRVVAAFGGKAARVPIPERARLVYAMAPATWIERRGGPRPVKIYLLPPPRAALDALHALNPGVRGLAVFWTSEAHRLYVRELQESAEGPLRILPVRVEAPEELPRYLRTLPGRADAFWVMPDPLLVDSETLPIYREFAWANGLAFLATGAELTRHGAAASLGVSPRSCGAAAARAVKSILAGEEVSERVFPPDPETAENSASAQRSGWVLREKSPGAPAP